MDVIYPFSSTVKLHFLRDIYHAGLRIYPESNKLYNHIFIHSLIFSHQFYLKSILAPITYLIWHV